MWKYCDILVRMEPKSSYLRIFILIIYIGQVSVQVHRIMCVCVRLCICVNASVYVSVSVYQLVYVCAHVSMIVCLSLCVCVCLSVSVLMHALCVSGFVSVCVRERECVCPALAWFPKEMLMIV